MMHISSRPNHSPAPLVVPTETVMLSATGLTRGFGDGAARSLALKGVSLELYSGEIVLLMGPSGSGKTTLLAILSGLLRPDEGQVYALGENLWTRSERDMEQFRLKHCSFVFQGCNLFPALTARQQLEIVLRWGDGLSGREARRRSEAMLTKLGLGKKLSLRPAQMSGGEKQRCAIGRALVKNPSFLFADEPTSALDWENGQQVIELLRKVAREQRATVLVVTHDNRLLSYADRVIHMADGHLVDAPDHDAAHAAPGPRTDLRKLIPETV